MAKNMIGSGAIIINVVGVGGVNPEKDNSEVLYNEELKFLANQGGGYRAKYPRPSKNPNGI